MEIGEIKNLYSDRARSRILLPKTKTKAVSNEEGVNLDVLLEDKASKDFVVKKVTEAQLGGEVDLSDYVTKEDLEKIDFPVDSVNGKTGIVSLSAEDVGAAPASLVDHVDQVAINNNKLVKESIITDVLGVDLDNSDGVWNRSGYFDSSAANCPPNTAFGVRDVHWVNAGFVIVEARCFITDSSSRIVRRTYNANAGGWGDWEWLDKRAFAPSGYGLGDQEASQHIDNCDNALQNGWYFINPNAVNSPFGDGNGAMRVDAHTGGSQVMQTAFSGNYTSLGFVVLQRFKFYGVWQPWEWINPPMVGSTEYRTTERYMGKPVYTALFEFGAMPNSTSKQINVSGYGIADIVSFIGIGVNANYKIDLQCIPGVTEIYYNSSTKYLGITTTTDRSGYSAYITIKYTKA